MSALAKTTLRKATSCNQKNWPPTTVLNPGINHKWVREVVFDFHEVCVKWVESFAEFVNQTYPHLKLSLAKNQTYFFQYDPSTSLSPDQFDEVFAAFVRLSVGGYGDLEPHIGIKEAMEKIVASGIKINIWSFVPGANDVKHDNLHSYNTGIAQHATRELIRKLGLPVDIERDVRFVHQEAKKWELAKEHIPLIVEDNPETAVGVARGIGHAAILVPESYNRGLKCPNVLRLNRRSELADAVISFYQKLDDANCLL